MSVIDDVRIAMSEIAEDVKAVLHIVLESDKGINEKVGVNTLVGSNLYNEIKTMVGEDIEVVLLFVNDYIDYIERGRQSGTWPPPHIIAAWCQRKGIPSDNSTVFLICRSIYEKGIAPRPIFDGADGAWEVMDKHWEEWADNLFEAITNELDKFFNE